MRCAVLQDPAEPNLIFVGTEQGLWVSLDNGASFQQWKMGIPSVSTYDMVIQEREADLAIATFGRAVMGIGRYPSFAQTGREQRTD